MAWSNQEKRSVFQKASMFFGLVSGVLVILLELKMFEGTAYVFVDNLLTVLVVVLAACLAGNMYFKSQKNRVVKYT